MAAELFKGAGPNPKHAEWADRLRRIVSARGAAAAPALGARDDWISDFAFLAKRRGPESVEAVLAWFERAAGGEFVPQVRHAKDFVRKFDQLAAARSRDITEEKPDPVVDRRLDEMTRRLAGEHAWPPEVAAALPQLVRRTAANWWKFFMAMEDCCCDSNRPIETREISFLLRVMKTQSPVFVANWFALLAQKYAGRPRFLGDVSKLAFAPASELFRDSLWRAWALEWAGDATAFDTLLEKLKGV